MKKISKVLLIDDNIDLCKQIVDFFKDTEFEMKAVHSGREGLERIEEEEFDCILLDLRMPGMNGEEVFEKIKDKVEKLSFVIIILTAHGSISKCAYMLKEGVSEFIEKHIIDYEALVKVVKKNIETLHLKKKNKKLEMAFEGYSYGMAHNLKNNLTAIGLISQRLREMLKRKDALADEYLLEKIEKIIRNVKESDRVIEKVLKFSKKRSDLFATTPVNIKHLNNIINESLQLLQDQYCDFNILDKFKIVPDFYEGEERVKIDTNLVKDAFCNLIKNSFDALENAEDKEKILHINTLLKDMFLEVSIRDNGIGLSKRNLERIFDPFFTTKKDGLGIGLFWVKTIIESICNGSIECHSREKEWTEFVIKLPLTE